jgi:p-hydroxybenzoate 3-monooxygenase
MIHNGINLCFDGALHHLNFRELVGKGIAIYGQQEIVKDLITQRLADDTEIFFEVGDVRVKGFDSEAPTIHFRHDGGEKEIACDFIGGCDGFHGICRPSMPSGVLTAYEREYPFAWLGILAEAPTRLDGTRAVTQGNVLQKGVTPMRSFVAEPMQYGRLFLAGDAAHIVPPAGAKGMNLAFADVLILSRAITMFYTSGSTDLLDAYSATCSKRVWKAQRFSLWMTQLLHRFTFERDFDYRRQLAELDYLVSSRAAATALAENYVGLPME